MRNSILPIVALFLLTFATAGFSQTETMRIAVLDLQPQGVSEQIAMTVSDILRTELVKTGIFTIIERKEMGNILQEQQFQLSGSSETAYAAQVGKLLSARKILVGSVSKLGNSFIINARIVDVEKGVVEFGESAKVGSESELDTGCSVFAKKLAMEISRSDQAKIPKKTVYPLRTVGYISAGIGLISLGTGLILDHQVDVDTSQAHSLYIDYNKATSGFTKAWNAYADMVTLAGNLTKDRNILYISAGVTGAFGLVSIFLIRKEVYSDVSFKCGPDQIALSYKF